MQDETSTGPESEPGDSSAGDEVDELQRLRDENERLRAELAAAPSGSAAVGADPVARSTRRRTIASIAFVVLGSLLLPMAVITVWTRNQVLNTDRYVRTVEPLAEDPAVTSALASRITTAVARELDVKSLAAEALPERAAFLAAPIASGAESLIRQAATRLVESERFRTLWREANRRGHDALVAVLTGESGKIVSTKDGKVVISLAPIVAEVLQAVDEQFGIDISSRVPTSRIDVDFEIIDSRQLAQAQTYVRLLDRMSWLTVLASLGLLVAGAFVASDRRKGLFRVGVGVAVSMLVMLIAMSFTRDMYLTNLPEGVQRADAAAVIFDTLTRYLVQSVRVVLVVGLVVVVATWLAGPSSAARRLRGWWDVALGRGSAGIGGVVDLGPVPRFVAAHAGVLRVVVAGLAVLTLLTWNLPTGKVVVLIALATLVPLAVIQLLAGIGREHPDDSPPGSPPGSPPSESALLG